MREDELLWKTILSLKILLNRKQDRKDMLLSKDQAILVELKKEYAFLPHHSVNGET